MAELRPSAPPQPKVQDHVDRKAWAEARRDWYRLWTFPVEAHTADTPIKIDGQIVGILAGFNLTEDEE